MDSFENISISYKRYEGTKGALSLSNMTEKYYLSDDDTEPQSKYEEIISSGELYTCGLNNYGQLGCVDLFNRSSPVQIPGSQWIKTTCGHEFTLGLKSDGTLWSWGRNDVGQLGLGDSIHRSSPTQIPGTTWKDILSPSGNTSGHTLALREDGTLWTWGDNQFGQLGLNDKLTRYSPTQIVGYGWRDLSIGFGWSGVMKEDNTIWLWGLNDHGQLGQNDLNNRSSPTQIPGADWRKIGAFGGKSCAAIKEDTTLWTWGHNGHGALAQYFGPYGSINLSSPTQVVGHRDWNFVGGGEHHMFAMKNDNTYWGWGLNNHGNSGLLTSPTTLEYPLQGRNFNVRYASGGRIATYLQEDGYSLRSVGYNHDGNLGVFDRSSRNSPVQLPGSGWASGGGQHVALVNYYRYNQPKQTL